MAFLRKILILSILYSMTLHCMCRIGVLSYLYQQRFEIAYYLHVIKEVPLALCSSDYHPNDSLSLSEQSADDQTPSSLTDSDEIILFCLGGINFPVPVFTALEEKHLSFYQWSLLNAPCKDILRPPTV